MKLWIFVEGDSEEIFAEKMIQREFPNALREKDRLEFLTHPDDQVVHLFYIENCGNVEAVPHEINSKYHYCESISCFDILVICDIERDPGCASSRKDLIESKLEPNVIKQKIKYVFSRQSIEEIYWDYPETMKRVVKIIYEKRSLGAPPLIQVPAKPTSGHLGELKDFCKKHGLKYREPEFAELFFPRIKHSTSSNSTIKRLYAFLSSFFPDN